VKRKRNLAKRGVQKTKRGPQRKMDFGPRGGRSPISKAAGASEQAEKKGNYEKLKVKGRDKRAFRL